ncbi:helix-turn-helix domain-containing protein [Massilibacteroides sp.]|uniref:winged helix-turn-helix transcriptional regulator n=1 Tax=Massilibacteroides sp. TaxID=2034766 RepID=UPI0026175C90|nr:helix-turn-helix domain-containing protein [Massilibacteroides sp.]MDD4514643.1 helix-turn-helix domain-containing protein [Massilibacteroides sp.]
MNEELLKKYSNAEHCPVRCILSRIGDKWSVLVILLLGEGERLRFNEISRSLGNISQKMLTTTLRSLVSDGLVERTLYPEIPPRVEYELTELGQSLLPHINQLSSWALENMEQIMHHRQQIKTTWE